MDALSTVFVAKADLAICKSIKAIASVLGLPCEVYATARQFLDAFDQRRPGCLVLEIGISDEHDRQIQQLLFDVGATLPVVCLSDATSVSLAVGAMRMGALHVLERPCRKYDLLSAIQEAIEVDQERRKAAFFQESIDARISLLSSKEFAVMKLLADCKSKRAMAEELGVSIRSIEHYRTILMRKMKTNSIAGLMRFALAVKHSNPRLLERRLPNQPGNGFDAGTQEFVPHNGSHTRHPSLVSVRRLNPE